MVRKIGKMVPLGLCITLCVMTHMVAAGTFGDTINYLTLLVGIDPDEKIALCEFGKALNTTLTDSWPCESNASVFPKVTINPGGFVTALYGECDVVLISSGRFNT